MSSRNILLAFDTPSWDFYKVPVEKKSGVYNKVLMTVTQNWISHSICDWLLLMLRGCFFYRFVQMERPLLEKWNLGVLIFAPFPPIHSPLANKVFSYWSSTPPQHIVPLFCLGFDSENNNDKTSLSYKPLFMCINSLSSKQFPVKYRFTFISF